MIRKAKKLVDLELVAISGENVASVSALGLADVTDTEKERLQWILDAKLAAEPAVLGCTDWIKYEIDVGTARPIKQSLCTHRRWRKNFTLKFVKCSRVE